MNLPTGWLAVIAIMAFVPGCAQVTPKHRVPATPPYIRAGVKPGDDIEIVTRDGQTHRFVVVDVMLDHIRGPDGDIPFDEIERISVRSWEPPELPCGGTEPVGCSIPEVVLVLSEDYRNQAEKFHPACVQHDFCYRHGHATYGETREDCDRAFYDDMKDACGGPSNLGMLDLKEYGICQVAAQQTYEAVRRHGAGHFEVTGSTYCEYRLPPAAD